MRKQAVVAVPVMVNFTESCLHGKSRRGFGWSVSVNLRGATNSQRPMMLPITLTPFPPAFFTSLHFIPFFMIPHYIYYLVALFVS